MRASRRRLHLHQHADGTGLLGRRQLGVSDTLADVSESYLVRFGVTFEKHLAEEMARPVEVA